MKTFFVAIPTEEGKLNSILNNSETFPIEIQQSDLDNSTPQQAIEAYEKDVTFWEDRYAVIRVTLEAEAIAKKVFVFE